AGGQTTREDQILVLAQHIAERRGVGRERQRRRRPDALPMPCRARRVAREVLAREARQLPEPAGQLGRGRVELPRLGLEPGEFLEQILGGRGGTRHSANTITAWAGP